MTSSTSEGPTVSVTPCRQRVQEELADQSAVHRDAVVRLATHGLPALTVGPRVETWAQYQDHDRLHSQLGNDRTTVYVYTRQQAA